MWPFVVSRPAAATYSSYSASDTGAEYCDECVCVCLCLSVGVGVYVFVCDHVLELHVQSSPNFWACYL